MMIRTLALALAAAAPALFALAPAASAQKQMQIPVSSLDRPNIVVVMIDDVGVDKIGAYNEGPPGIDPPCTPNFNSLAAEGVLFRNAWGTPLCSPTRAQVLMGQHGFRSGIGHLTPSDGSQPGLRVDLGFTLANALFDYERAALGKWHLANVQEQGFQHALDAGFHHFAGSMFNLGRPAVDRGTGEPVPSCNTFPLGYANWVKVMDTDANGTLEQTCSPNYATTDTADDAIVMAQSMQEPWFMFVGFNAAHTPIDLPPSSLCASGGTCSKQYCPVTSLDPAEWSNAIIEALDTEFGRMVAGIRAVDPDAYIILVGDNGSEGQLSMAPPGDCFDAMHSKGTLFEAGINVPLIIAGPDVVPGECDALVSCADIFNTCTELAHIAARAEDSVSMVPYLRGRMHPRREFVYSELFHPNQRHPNSNGGAGNFLPDWHYQAVRNENFKLLRLTLKSGNTVEQFYDLSADPCETSPLCDLDCSVSTLSPDSFLQYQLLEAQMQATYTPYQP